MEEVQKPISRNCNIALSVSCKTDNLNCSLGRAQDLKHYGNSIKRRRRDLQNCRISIEQQRRPFVDLTVGRLEGTTHTARMAMHCGRFAERIRASEISSTGSTYCNWMNRYGQWKTHCTLQYFWLQCRDFTQNSQFLSQPHPTQSIKIWVESASYIEGVLINP